MPSAQPALRLLDRERRAEEPAASERPAEPVEGPAVDARLMALVAQGDRQAFGELVEKYEDALVAYLSRLTGDRDRAEDLAQDTFLRLFHAASKSYRERGQLTAFLYRIATNLVRSEERRAKRWRLIRQDLRPAGSAGIAMASVEAHAPDHLLREESRKRLIMAIAELPLRLRIPLVLAEIEDWPQREIARFLDCRVGTVKSRLFRARERLRRRLTPYFKPEEEPAPKRELKLGARP